MEANPNTFDPEKARVLVAGGVNRISFGARILPCRGIADSAARSRSRERSGGVGRGTSGGTGQSEHGPDIRHSRPDAGVVGLFPHQGAGTGAHTPVVLFADLRAQHRHDRPLHRRFPQDRRRGRTGHVRARLPALRRRLHTLRNLQLAHPPHAGTTSSIGRPAIGSALAPAPAATWSRQNRRPRAGEEAPVAWQWKNAGSLALSGGPADRRDRSSDHPNGTLGPPAMGRRRRRVLAPP